MQNEQAAIIILLNTCTFLLKLSSKEIKVSVRSMPFIFSVVRQVQHESKQG